MKNQKYPKPLRTSPDRCLYKRSFKSKKEADTNAEGMRSYRCNVCNNWHLTSNRFNKNIEL